MAIGTQPYASAFQITFVSTTSWVLVADLPEKQVYRNIMVENYTNGDIELRFGPDGDADFIVKVDTDKVITDDEFFGPLYARNSSGTGGNVYIRAWR